jgi:hypothetical protein
MLIVLYGKPLVTSATRAGHTENAVDIAVTVIQVANQDLA